GMFSRVTLAVGVPAKVVSVPEIAVTYSLSGDSVFVVGAAENDKPRPVEQRVVKLGETRDGFIAVLSGLKVGEMVVTTGQLKLYPGGTAVIDNAVLPKPSAETARY